MQKILYVSIMGNLIYAQLCIGPNIAYIVKILGKNLSNSGLDHWKTTIISLDSEVLHAHIL